MLRITIKEKPTFKKKSCSYARRIKAKKLLNYLQSELKASTTHGLPYIANTEIHWFERIFWAASFTISCTIICVLLSSQYTRLMATPIVNSVEKDYLNWNVSYPAVVICPFNKLNNETFASFINETLNRTGQDLHSYYSAILSVSLEELNVLDMPPPEVLELIVPEDYSTIAANLYRQFRSNESLTTFLNWPVTVTAAMTEMGMCHILNSNVAVFEDPNLWTQSGVSYSKKNIDISIHDIDFFIQILNYADEYKVYAIGPDEVILSGSPSITFDQEGFLTYGLHVTSTKAADDLKYIPLHLRKCRFLHESNSKRYPIYSYNRCLLECRIKLIIKLCGCIPHFYKPLDDEKVCSLAELECVLEYKREITTLSVSNETRNKFKNIEELPRTSRDCGCLGNCEEDVYKTDQTILLPQENMNRFRISVTAFPKVRVKREIIFNFYDILLRSGGVVNLCIGTSVISLMELILTALRIPIYEIIQIVNGICRRYKRSQSLRMALNKKQM